MSETEAPLPILARSLELAAITGQSEGVSGEHEGLAVELRQSGEAVRISIEAPAGLRLVPAALGGRAARDLRVGHPALDEAMMIQGENPAAAIRILRGQGLADALVAVHTKVGGFLLEEGRLRAEVPLQGARLALREVLSVAHLLHTHAEAEDLRAQAQRRTVQPPVRPLRDLSGEVDALPPVHPLHAAAWRKILQRDRRVAWVAGPPFIALCVGLALTGAPKWTLVFPVVLMGGMLVIKGLLFRCPSCSLPLERHGPLLGAKALICPRCGTRLS